MLFSLSYIFLFVGLIMAGIMGLMPTGFQSVIPDIFRFVFFMFGCVLCFIALFLIQGRALKTGTIHLLDYGKPGTINWLYVHTDGTIEITPSLREVEGQLYSPKLDAQIKELKSYRIFDHSIRIVPEGVGHAVDLDMVLYANLLRSKNGITNLRQARDSVFRKTEPIVSNEEIMVNDNDEQIRE